jgi:hypothetical protein
MEPQDKGSSEPWMVALLGMTADNLWKPEAQWFLWIQDLTTEGFKRLLMRILTTVDLATPRRERMLDLLGTTAGTMTPSELATWAPLILLSRNRALATRDPIAAPSPVDSNQE